MKKLFWSLTSLIILSLVVSCTGSKQSVAESKYVVTTSVRQPEWSKDAVIYEVNIRQHTAEGTFNAFIMDMPRLKELGIDILWLMPIYPIGEKFRKATQTKLVDEIEDPEERKKYLGSYYSIKDFKAINSEYGALDDLKELINKAHELGMYVILDIAVNHTAWDHEWITTHPEYYTKIDTSNPPWNKEWMQQHPVYYKQLKKWGITYPDPENETDWWDTADLNYGNEDMRNEMIKVFKYWVTEADADGYRCDVAGRVPCDFWNDVRTALDSLKQVFMLAEDEHSYCLYEHAFNMNYGWELFHKMNELAEGEISINDLEAYFEKHDSIFDPAIYRMNFITNHDENSWNGTVFERLGDAVEVYAFLTFTVPGMPLLYSGQENGLDKRLRFFTKDTIHWIENKWENIYKDLIHAKKENKALWNGTYGGTMEILETKEEGVFAFKRGIDDNEVIAICNLSDGEQVIDLDIKPDKYTLILGDKEEELDHGLTLGAYEYMLLLKGK